MTKRRLLFIGGTREPGGVHVHTADVAQAAAQLDCQVTIASITIDFFSSLVSPEFIKVEVFDRLCIERQIQRPYRTLPSRCLSWLALLARHRGSDIALVHGAFAQTPAVELLIVGLAARRLYTIEHSPGLLGRESRAAQRRYGTAMRLGVRRTVAVSQDIRNLAVQECGLTAESVALCTNWVSPSFRPPSAAERAAARAELNLPEGAIAIGYVGRLSSDKRGDILLRAFAEASEGMPNQARLILGGDGWKADDWSRLARELGIAGRVRFTGWQSDPSRVYRALDVFVLPSLVEGFPLGVMEAMATGVPSVAHPMGSTLSLIEDGVTGFIQDMNEPSALATRLRSLFAADPTRLRAMGLAASAEIDRHHSRQARLPPVLAALDIPLDGRALPPPPPPGLKYRRWDSAS